MTESLKKILETAKSKKISDQGICRLLGANRNKVDDWKKGKSSPTVAEVALLAHSFDVSADYLLGITPSPISLDALERAGLEARNPDSDWVQIPIYGKVAAGYGALALEEFDGYEILETSMVKNGDLSDYFFLRVKGDSMNPDIKEGDLVLVRKQQDIDYGGQVAVVITDDEEGTLKRVYKREKYVELRPINPSYEIKIILNGQFIQICGVVKKQVRNWV